jgi:hypothetical protein
MKSAMPSCFWSLPSLAKPIFEMSMSWNPADSNSVLASLETPGDHNPDSTGTDHNHKWGGEPITWWWLAYRTDSVRQVTRCRCDGVTSVPSQTVRRYESHIEERVELWDNPYPSMSMVVCPWCPCRYSCTPLQRSFRKPKVLRDETFLVVLTSKLSVALMMKLDNEMNYNVDHLTMFSMLLSNELIHFKNRNMSHEHVILLMNAMLVYKGTNAW